MTKIDRKWAKEKHTLLILGKNTKTLQTKALKGNLQRMEAARDRVKKSKALTELNVSRDIKGNKGSFCWSAGDRRKTEENTGSLCKEKEYLVTCGMEKAEVLNYFFCLSFH